MQFQVPNSKIDSKHLNCLENRNQMKPKQRESRLGIENKVQISYAA